MQTYKKIVHQCVGDYLNSLCTHVKTEHYSENIKDISAAIKTSTGLSVQTASILKKKDGTVNKSEKLKRWIEHYSYF